MNDWDSDDWDSLTLGQKNVAYFIRKMEEIFNKMKTYNVSVQVTQDFTVTVQAVGIIEATRAAHEHVSKNYVQHAASVDVNVYKIEEE